MTSKLFNQEDVFKSLGLDASNSGVCGHTWHKGHDELTSINPTTGKPLATVTCTSEEDYEKIVKDGQEAFKIWRNMPAPRRGEIIREIGDAVREKKEDLAALHTLEVGKVPSEGGGEVQEVIDICDFAVGLSRQLYGLTMASERPSHRLYEQWHPLGEIGVITAFNFPSAVWSWNSIIGTTCGNTIIVRRE